MTADWESSQGANALVDQWVDAVEWGGRGYYARAATALRQLAATPRTPPWLISVALSTRASHLRQQGQHHAALRYDAQALRRLGPADRHPDPADRGHHTDGNHTDGNHADCYCAAARADALLGIAADHLGTGQAPAALRLLDRIASDVRDCNDPRWPQRAYLRWLWVRAETGLVLGADALEQLCDNPVTPAHLTATALAVVPALGSARHTVKTELLHAVTTRSSAQPVYDAAVAADLLPLQWAAALVMARDDLANAAEQELCRRGAVMTRPW